MGRYVLPTGSGAEDQTWTIERDGRTLTIDGVVEALADDKLAATRFNVLVNQKLRAGYKLWKPPAEPNPPMLPDAPVVYDARNLELEAAIFADPRAAEPYLIYGDWLQQQGDPRGELIARYAQVKNDPRLAQSIGARLRRYAEYFYGGLELEEDQRVTFEWGFISSIELRASFMNDHALERPLEQLLGIASARFVRAIELDDADGQGNIDAGVRVIAERAPATLHAIALRGNAWLNALDALAPRLPAVDDLAITAKLAPRSSCIATLIDTPLPKLRSLELELGTGDATIEHVRPLFRRRDIGVTSLLLRAELDDALCELIAGAAFARTLDTLALPRVYSNDGDIERLLALLDTLPALTSLEIPKLPDAIWARLAARIAVSDWSERYDSIDE